MRRIAIILGIMLIGLGSQAQILNPFPTTDSLRKFVNKWIRNSAVDAFTNLRLNTALIGMSRFIDSAVQAGSGVDTFYAVNDSTVRLVTSDGRTFNAVLPGNGDALRFGNGVFRRGDSVLLGGRLKNYAIIETPYNKRYPVVDNAGVIITNRRVDSSMFDWIENNPPENLPYQPSGLYISERNFNDDSLNKSYGGPLAVAARDEFDTSNVRYISPSRPLFITHKGGNFQGQLFPPKVAYVQTSPFGHHMAAMNAQLDFGQNAPYKITTFSQTNIANPYPLVVYRSGLDFARLTSTVKREMYGAGISGYIVDMRHHQANITSGTPNYRSYINNVNGFHFYGLISEHLESPSKVKTDSVSVIDTAIAFRADSIRRQKNEVRNGLAFLQTGRDDANYFAGKVKIGGTSWPLYGTQKANLHVNDTAATVTIGAASYLEDVASVNINTEQRGLTNATIGSRKQQALFVNKDNYYGADNVTLSGRFGHALQVYNTHIATNSLSLAAAGNGDVAGAQIGMAYRKTPAFGDTTIFQGGATAATAPVGLFAFTDMAESSLTAAKLNWAPGYHAAFAAGFMGNAWNRVGSPIDVLVGYGQPFSSNGGIDTGYRVYILPHTMAAVTNKYAIYQAGTADTNYFAGPLRAPNLTTGTNTDSVVVVSAGVFKRVAQSSIGGGGGGSGTVTSFTFTDGSGFDGTVSNSTTTPTLSLTTTLTNTHIPIIGASGALTGSAALTNDGTTTKQENATAAVSVTSTTTPGTTSGGDHRAFIKASPTAANQRMGGYMFGTLDGGSTENITAGIEAYSNGAHTPGSSEQTFVRVLTSATSTMNEVQRWTANGRTGIGSVTNPSATVHIAAGSSALHPFMLTSQTSVSSPLAGGFEFASVSSIPRLGFSAVNGTMLRIPLTNDAAPSNGQMAVGNGTNYTVSDVFGIITVTATGTTTLSAGNKMTTIKADATSGNIIITLTANHPGQVVNILKINTTNTVTIAASSGSLLYGSTSLSTQGEGEHYQWDGTNWLALP